MAITRSYNTVIIHKDEGYRSESMNILCLLTLKDNGNKGFLEHFNDNIAKIANALNIPTKPFQNSKEEFDTLIKEF